LSVNDSELWEKIASLYKESEYFEQACYSFGKALKKDPNNVKFILERYHISIDF
jgi:hypothetical protein